MNSKFELSQIQRLWGFMRFWQGPIGSRHPGTCLQKLKQYKPRVVNQEMKRREISMFPPLLEEEEKLLVHQKLAKPKPDKT